MKLLSHEDLSLQIIRRPAWRKYYSDMCKAFEKEGMIPPSQKAVLNNIIGEPGINGTHGKDEVRPD